jgi:DNA-binding PadR family transcriptional regulator
MSIKTRAKGIFEITQAGHATQREALTGVMPIRGFELAIQRIPATQNGKMRLDLQERREVPFELPPEPDIIAILSRMWEQHSSKRDDKPWSREEAEEQEKREREEINQTLKIHERNGG